MNGRSVMAAGLAGALMVALAAPAQAAMTGAGLNAPVGAPLLQLAQFGFPNPLDFMLGGRNYCWYDDGWRGPGWYWCGYGSRYGYGWGGGEGFNGWREHRYERDWHGHGGGGGGGRHDHGGTHGGGMHGGGGHGGGGHGGGGHGGGGHGGDGHGGGGHQHP